MPMLLSTSKGIVLTMLPASESLPSPPGAAISTSYPGPWLEYTAIASVGPMEATAMHSGYFAGAVT